MLTLKGKLKKGSGLENIFINSWKMPVIKEKKSKPLDDGVWITGWFFSTFGCAYVDKLPKNNQQVACRKEKKKSPWLGNFYRKRGEFVKLIHKQWIELMKLWTNLLIIGEKHVIVKNGGVNCG